MPWVGAEKKEIRKKNINDGKKKFGVHFPRV
jgi:hypothetical protein